MGSAPALFELRIALVMFGGTSLAVYMNGVVMELLALIRACQQQDQQSDYWPVINGAAAEICIDIISGTSAGGLNALVLAHALATGSDATGLKELWLSKAQFSELLRTEDPHAILSADVMESKLREILTQMSEPPANPIDAETKRKLRDQVPVLDLFLTATDVRGRIWSRADDLFGQPVTGVRNQHLFHLKKRSVLAETGRSYARNDFLDDDRKRQHARNELLMRVGRATSAFPGVLPPVAITRGACADAGLEHILNGYDRETVWFSDGGILVNKPFEPVIRTICGRSATKAVERVLLYLEPDPVDAPEQRQLDEPHLLEIAAAPYLLPRNEDISSYLDEITGNNERRERMRRTFLAIEDEFGGSGADSHAGPTFAVYRRLRFNDTLRAVEAGVSASLAHVQDAGTLAALVIVQLRERYALVGDEHGAMAMKPAQLRFMRRFDVAFQMRRLHYLLLLVAEYAGQFTRPDPLLLDAQQHLWNALEDWNNASWLMANALSPAQVQDDALRAAFAALQVDHPERAASVRAAVRALACTFIATAARASREVRAALGKVRAALADDRQVGERQLGERGGRGLAQPFRLTADRFADAVKHFTGRDLLLFPLTAGGQAAQWDRIAIGRLTPDAATSIGRGGRAKLASDTLGHFGGFLSELWRRNDMMWGRLDTAELLLDLIWRQAQKYRTAEERQALRTAIDLCLERRQRAILVAEQACLNLGQLRRRCSPGSRADASAESIIHGAHIADLREYLRVDHTVGEQDVGAIDRGTLVTTILGVLDNLTLAVGRPAPGLALPARLVQVAAEGLLKPIHRLARLLLGPGPGWWLRALLLLIDRRLLLAVLALGALGGAAWLLDGAVLLPHPLAAVPVAARWPVLAGLGAGTVLSAVLRAVLGRLPRTLAAPRRIVSLELAGSRERAARILAAWRNVPGLARERLGFSLGIDFLFILGYAPLLSLGALMAGDAVSAAWPLTGPVGVAVAWGQLVAGLLAMVENVALMRTVLRPEAEWAPRLARICARGKFALVVLGLTFIGLALLYRTAG